MGRGRVLGVITAVSMLGLPGSALAAFANSTLLVSRPSGLGPVPPAFDNSSFPPAALSSSGRYAAFASDADGFAPGGNPLFGNILLRDTATNTTTLVSRSDGPNGVGANRDSSDPVIAVAPAGVMPTPPTNKPHVLVAFDSYANNLVDHATHSKITPVVGGNQVWLRDVTAGTTTLISRANGVSGAASNLNVFFPPSIAIAPGGPVVAFASDSSSLGSGGVVTIFLRTVNPGATELIACQHNTCGSTPSPAQALDPAVQVNGSYVDIAFDTKDQTMTGDSAGHSQVMYAQALAPTTPSSATGPPSAFVLVSKVGGLPANGDSTLPSWNETGTDIAFLSTATDLTTDSVPGGTTHEAFDHNLSSLNNVLLSRASDFNGTPGAVANGDVRSVALGGDASHLRAAFDSNASDLGGVPGSDSYARDVASGTTTVLNRQSGSSGALGNPPFAAGSTISSDGSAALFGAASSNLGDGSGTLFERIHLRTLPANDVSAGRVELISRPSGTKPFMSLTDASFITAEAVSADGRYVAFTSQSPSLSTLANPQYFSVYVRDLLKNQTILVSRASGANGAAADANAFLAGISANGHRVLFLSAADNLSPSAPSGVQEAYVRDLRSDTTSLVSRAGGAKGAPATSDATAGAISANGQVVVLSTASALAPAGAGGHPHLYARNLRTGATILVDRDNGPKGTPSGMPPFEPAPDANGNRIAFVTYAPLAGAPADGFSHVYVRDLTAGTTTLVDRADGTAGAAGNGRGTVPSIDATGNIVAFESDATNLGANTESGVFVRNLPKGHTQLVSPTTIGGQPALDYAPAIDARGDRVSFDVISHDFGDEIAHTEIYVADLSKRTTELVSRASGANGAPAVDRGNTIVASSMSANGNCVGFEIASNLGDGFPSFDFFSIHMRVLSGECPINPPNTLITKGPQGVTRNTRVTFAFHSNEPRVTFQCRLDAKKFTSCTSPVTVGPLANGHHVFATRAIDRAGYADTTPAVRHFSVKP